jgi:hypothetical protein
MTQPAGGSSLSTRDAIAQISGVAEKAQMIDIRFPATNGA